MWNICKYPQVTAVLYGPTVGGIGIAAALSPPPPKKIGYIRYKPASVILNGLLPFQSIPCISENAIVRQTKGREPLPTWCIDVFLERAVAKKRKKRHVLAWLQLRYSPALFTCLLLNWSKVVVFFSQIHKHNSYYNYHAALHFQVEKFLSPNVLLRAF